MTNLTGFIDFLDQQGVWEKKLPFYKMRVEQYLEYCENRSFEVRAKSSINKYRATLSRTLEDWAVKQAVDAVNYFIHWEEVKELQKREGYISDVTAEYLDRFVKVIRLQSKSLNTEKNYLREVRNFISYHCKDAYVAEDIEDYLKFLAVEKKSSKSTINSALSILQFFYKYVLGYDVSSLCSSLRLRNKRSIPVYFSLDEIRQIFSRLEGEHLLMAQLMYGSGLRNSEVYNLRIKDIEWQQKKIFVYSKKTKSRLAPLSDKVLQGLSQQINKAKEVYERDRRSHLPGVPLCNVEKSSLESLDESWEMFWLFPSKSLSCSVDGLYNIRNHVERHSLGRKLKAVLKECQIFKDAKAASLRHSFAVHLVKTGVNLRDLQEHLGHSNIKDTQIYSFAIQNIIKDIRSPMDDL